ncbi:MAG: hypothetical protein BGO07_04220 [Alphaproteobacteria bacterium 40-19]|nr:MAG: hypothetical protein BGO07_04220 [Alphaproteobacteria bacterium 40-19]
MLRHFIIVLGILTSPQCSAGWWSSVSSYFFPEKKTLPPEPLHQHLPQSLNQENLAKSGFFDFFVSVQDDLIVPSKLTTLEIKDDLPKNLWKETLSDHMGCYIPDFAKNPHFNPDLFKDVRSVVLERFTNLWEKDISLLGQDGGVPPDAKKQTLWSVQERQGDYQIGEWIGYGNVVGKIAETIVRVKKEDLEISLSGYPIFWDQEEK